MASSVSNVPPTVKDADDNITKSLAAEILKLQPVQILVSVMLAAGRLIWQLLPGRLKRTASKVG
jgi:hypothetical protein